MFNLGFVILDLGFVKKQIAKVLIKIILAKIGTPFLNLEYSFIFVLLSLFFVYGIFGYHFGCIARFRFL